MLGFLPVAGAQNKARQTGRTAGTWQASLGLGVCLQSGRIAGRARWTRSLRTSLGGDVVEQAALDKKLLAIDGMRKVRCDECQFRMTSVADAEKRGTCSQGNRGS